MSGAGYYIGCYCPECGPNNRESGYYRSREIAQADLDHLNAHGYLTNPRL